MKKEIKMKSGLVLELDEKVMDNMELVDTLAEASEEDPLAVSKMVRLILGNEKRKLYDSLRTEDGRVPVEAVSNALKEIFESFGEKGKN
jgi:hypothetical protein|nr:hypothetical protein [uncultured Acetatifactor sp.]